MNGHPALDKFHGARGVRVQAVGAQAGKRMVGTRAKNQECYDSQECQQDNKDFLFHSFLQ